MTIRNYTQKRKRQHLLISGITLLSCVSALFFMTVFSDIPISHLPQLLICFFQNENLSPQEKNYSLHEDAHNPNDNFNRNITIHIRRCHAIHHAQ